MTTQPFTEEELKRAKDNILNSFLFRYDTKDKVLAERVRLEFYGYPPDYLETYKAALEKVTVADLNAAAKKYIHPDKYAVLVVGNGPEIKPGLDELKMGPVHNIDITIPGAPGEKSGGAEGQAVSKESSKSEQSTPKLAVVIMAAGKGTRLKSRRPKVLHEVGGKPLLSHVIATAGRLAENEDIYAIIGHQAERVREAVAGTGVQFIEQTGAARNRTRHSVRARCDFRVRAHPGAFRRRAADPGGDIAAPDDASSGGRCGDDDSDRRAGRSHWLWPDCSSFA